MGQLPGVRKERMVEETVPFVYVQGRILKGCNDCVHCACRIGR